MSERKVLNVSLGGLPGLGGYVGVPRPGWSWGGFPENWGWSQTGGTGESLVGWGVLRQRGDPEGTVGLGGGGWDWNLQAGGSWHLAGELAGARGLGPKIVE